MNPKQLVYCKFIFFSLCNFRIICTRLFVLWDLSYGLGFVKSHWPQSIFYILPWFEVPIIGYKMEKRRLNISK